MKTRKKQKSSIYDKLFHKYSSNSTYMTLRQVKRLMKHEFKLVYNSHIMNSFIEIWGKRVDTKKVITKSTFKRLFKKPDGFFRDIKI